jgi:hypothetical protein
MVLVWGADVTFRQPLPILLPAGRDFSPHFQVDLSRIGLFERPDDIKIEGTGDGAIYLRFFLGGKFVV